MMIIYDVSVRFVFGDIPIPKTGGSGHPLYIIYARARKEQRHAFALRPPFHMICRFCPLSLTRSACRAFMPLA